MTTELVRPEDVREFTPAIASDPFLPCAYLPDAPKAGLVSMQVATLEGIAARPSASVIGLREDGAPTGIAVVEALSWDSEMLGIPFGRIHALHALPGDDEFARKQTLLSACVDYAREHGWRCMDANMHVQDLCAANASARCGFDIVATNIVIVWDFLRPIPPVPETDASIARAAPEDIPALEVLAATALDPFNRFAMDSRLPKGKAARIFGQWAGNSARGYAELVHLGKVEGEVLGYTCWRVCKPAPEHLGFSYVKFDLAGVNPNTRGKHLLTAMERAGLVHFQEQGFRYGSVTTHVLNAGLQRASGGWLGGHTRFARHTYHWHAE